MWPGLPSLQRGEGDRDLKPHTSTYNPVMTPAANREDPTAALRIICQFPSREWRKFQMHLKSHAKMRSNRKAAKASLIAVTNSSSFTTRSASASASRVPRPRPLISRRPRRQNAPGEVRRAVDPAIGLDELRPTPKRVEEALGLDPWQPRRVPRVVINGRENCGRGRRTPELGEVRSGGGGTSCGVIFRRFGVGCRPSEDSEGLAKGSLRHCTYAEWTQWSTG